MFGLFGGGNKTASKDAWHLEQLEIMLAPVAKQIGQDVKAMAKDFFNRVKIEIVNQMGDKAYLENIGDQMIGQMSANPKAKEMVDKRLSAGLTMDDIRGYWNMTPLMHNLQNKMLEMSDFMELHMAQQMGKKEEDFQAIAVNWRKTKPRWGDPEQWNPNLPVNKGFTADDADIYIEFYLRVKRWMEKTPVTQQTILLEGFNSYNAMLRDLIAKKEI